MEFIFNPDINYIGCTKKQHELTRFICQRYPDINYTSFKHDINYSLLLMERNQFSRFLIKFFYDLIFLVLGVWRCFKNFRWLGIPVVITLYLALLLSSPWYLWTRRTKQVNL